MSQALVPLIGGDTLLGGPLEGTALGVSTPEPSVYPALLPASPSTTAIATTPSSRAEPPPVAPPIPPSIQALPGARGHLVTGNPRYSDHVVATSQLASDVAEAFSVR